jgi:hypothetical protein
MKKSYVVGCDYQISHSPAMKAHANQPPITQGKFTDPALPDGGVSANDSARPMVDSIEDGLLQRKTGEVKLCRDTPCPSPSWICG